MLRLLPHFRLESRRLTILAAFNAVILVSGCETAQEANFERSNRFTELSSQIDTNAASDTSDLQGQATYNGVAAADFGEFSGTSDANLKADFNTKTISGSMTSWKDLDPENYELRGQVLLSNGVISDDGSFSSQMAGNIERDSTAAFKQGISPVLKVFNGDATGQIYNSVDGAVASHVNGSFEASSGDTISGSFIAGR